MITASRTTDQRRITRNSSHYKNVRKSLPGSLPEKNQIPVDQDEDQDLLDFEAGQETSCVSETIDERIKMDYRRPETPIEQPVLCLSERVVRPPVWTRDSHM